MRFLDGSVTLQMHGMIKGMTIQATTRRVKRSFTLTPEVAAFVTETRQKQRARSDSEALVLLLREAMLESRLRQIDAAYKEYYDTASEEELAEQSQWAEMAGPNIMADIESAEAETLTAPEARYPLRGEIWWTHFPTDPPDKGRRPVVVVSVNAPQLPAEVEHRSGDSAFHVDPQVPTGWHLLLRAGETGLREDCVAQTENICTVRRADMDEPIQGHRPISSRQICRLAGLVRLAMGCLV